MMKEFHIVDKKDILLQFALVAENSRENGANNSKENEIFYAKLKYSKKLFTFSSLYSNSTITHLPLAE